MASDRVEGLRRALELTPENHALRLLLAEALADEGDHDEAAREYRVLHDSGELPVDSLLPAGRSALAAGDVALAGALADAAQEAGVVEGVAELGARSTRRSASRV